MRHPASGPLNRDEAVSRGAAGTKGLAQPVLWAEAMSSRSVSAISFGWVLLGVLGTHSARAEQPKPSEEGPKPILDLGVGVPGDRELAALLWGRSPDLAGARLELTQAQADLSRAYQLPNPSLDLGIGTLPVGATNPPGLRPLVDVPNYSIGVSTPIEVAKRGPRQEAARSAQKAIALRTFEMLRQSVIDLKERIAAVASAEARVAAFSNAAQDAARLTELQQARASKGDAAGLDVDRSMLEQQKLESSVGEARQRLREALLGCSERAGALCRPFGDPDRAERYLDRAVEEIEAADLEQRPDLRALAEQEKSARSSLILARRKVIPDVTVRAGYVRDRFVISGNQPHSLFVGASIALPIFDYGAPEKREAAKAAETASLTRSLLIDQGKRDLEQLRAQLTDVRARRAALHDRTLPLARDVVKRLDQSVRAGAPLQDLLLARRTLEELIADAADVDLAAFQTAAELARVAGYAPPMPSELRIE